jgi:hypothetical protein
LRKNIEIARQKEEGRDREVGTIPENKILSVINLYVF